VNGRSNGSRRRLIHYDGASLGGKGIQIAVETIGNVKGLFAEKSAVLLTHDANIRIMNIAPNQNLKIAIFAVTSSNSLSILPKSNWNKATHENQ
jgi:hypothetical protein